MNNNTRLIFLVFSFFLIVNLASNGGHFDQWDGVETFLVTESMVLKHSAKLHPDVPSIEKLLFNIRYTVWANKELQTGKTYNYSTMQLEPVYTLRSLFLSAVAVPFYYAATIFSISPISLVAILVNSLIISLTSLLIFCFSLEIYDSKKIAFILSLIFGLCSFVWPYITSLWPQPLQALCIIASAFFIYMSLHHHFSFICQYSRPKNKGIYFAGLGGLFLGLSVFAHPTSAIVIPGFIVYSIFSMKSNRKSLYSFLILLGIILFFVGFVNYWRFGSFTEFGYGYYGSLSAHAGWEGLIGLLVSPGFGLIFYFPIAILLPLALKHMYRKDKGLFFLATYIIFVNWFWVGTLSYGEGSRDWSGATAWGPRYLIPVLPFITIVFGSLLLQLKKKLALKKMIFLKLSIIILCIAGFYVNLLGILVWYMYGYTYGWRIEGLWKSVNYMNIMTWNPYYSPIVLHTKALISDYLSHLQPEQYRYTSWYWTTYGLAPCSYDIYLFCKLGIMPTLLLYSVIAILAMLIIKEISKFNPLSFVIVQLKNNYGGSNRNIQNK
jgi:hypothetical protein